MPKYYVLCPQSRCGITTNDYHVAVDFTQRAVGFDVSLYSSAEAFGRITLRRTFISSLVTHGADCEISAISESTRTLCVIG